MGKAKSGKRKSGGMLGFFRWRSRSTPATAPNVAEAPHEEVQQEDLNSLQKKRSLLSNEVIEEDPVREESEMSESSTLSSSSGLGDDDVGGEDDSGASDGESNSSEETIVLVPEVAEIPKPKPQWGEDMEDGKEETWNQLRTRRPPVSVSWNAVLERAKQLYVLNGGSLKDKARYTAFLQSMALKIEQLEDFLAEQWDDLSNNEKQKWDLERNPRHGGKDTMRDLLVRVQLLFANIEASFLSTAFERYEWFYRHPLDKADLLDIWTEKEDMVDEAYLAWTPKYGVAVIFESWYSQCLAEIVDEHCDALYEDILREARAQ